MPTRLLLVAALGVIAPAQQFFIPDNDPSTGSCNIFPFGGTGGQNIKYQTLVTAAELSNQAGLISGMGFAQCGPGRHSFGTLEIVMAHSASASLSNDFAQNLGASPLTVLSFANYDWNVAGSSWEEVGLTSYFPFNGIDNVVIQVTATGSVWNPNGAADPGMRTANRQRLFAANWITPPATGTLSGTNTLKMELSMGAAKVSSHGRGCAGSNGLIPAMSVVGLPQLGQTVAFGLRNALPLTIAMRTLALDNGPPFPVDLFALGMPGCRLYQDLTFVSLALSDALGGASLPLTMPASPALVGVRFYGQWACLDPTVNGFGWTTSNYVRLQIGT